MEQRAKKCLSVTESLGRIKDVVSVSKKSQRNKKMNPKDILALVIIGLAGVVAIISYIVSLYAKPTQQVAAATAT